jgi:Xaa-Pro aminopeptidase
MTRIKRIQQALAKQKLDAIIVRVFEGASQNVLYLTGFSGSSAHLFITRHQAFIIADPRYWLRVADEVKGCRLVKLQRGGKASEIINQLLARTNLSARSRVGFEAAHVSVDLAGTWKKEIQATLVPTVHFVERFRQFKDEQEIELLRAACRSTSRVYNEVVPLIKPGMRENELAFEIDMRLRRGGAVSNSFSTIVAAGANAAVPHHATSNSRLKAGDPVIMDFGGVYSGGYCSDITRTVFVPGKQPAAKLVEVYNIVLAANKEAYRALKPGITWKEFDRAARDYIEKAGWGKYFSHGLGHSLGLVAHDPYDYENYPFDVGTVITDEPGIYIEGLGGVRIEDDLVVTANGAARLTNAPYWKF